MQFIIRPELTASDINRAARWYREKLGLEPVLHGNEPIAPGTTEFFSELLYDTGTAQFGIYESDHAGNNKATAARLIVDDFDAAFAELSANGVQFETWDLSLFNDEGEEPSYWDNGALVSPDGERTAWFKDSEGNILAIGSN